MSSHLTIGSTVGFDLLDTWHTGVVVDLDSHGTAVRYDTAGAAHKVWISWATVARKKLVTA